MNKQRGLSLSELLISLFLASVVSMTLIQLYLGCKRQYLAAEKILASGFDLQWVSDLMGDSIRRAGFTPCLGIDQLTTIDLRKNQNPIHSLLVGNQPYPFIQVQRMNENFTKLIKINNSKSIVVENFYEYHAKRPLIIADCIHAEVHELDSVENQGNQSILNLSKPLIFFYDTSAYIGEFIEERWFIKQNKNHKATLQYQSVHTEEVTPLIHSLSIRNQRIKNKQFLEVTMGLDDEKTHKIRVSVRGA